MKMSTYGTNTSGVAQNYAPGPALTFSGEVGIHLLLGKLRRPRPSGHFGGARYESVWAFITINPERTMHYAPFNDDVMNQVRALTQQHAGGEDLTFFSPIGKYMSICPVPVQDDDGPVQQVGYVPPPTSLMTNAAARPTETRPIWVDFYVHSASGTTAASLAGDISQQLRRLDTRLNDGPYGRNTLRLDEVPASRLSLTRDLAMTNKTWVCILEAGLLAATINKPWRPLLDLVTRFWGVRDRPSAVANYADLLGALSRDLYFAYARAGAMAGRTSQYADPDLMDDPGFLMLVRGYLLELAQEMGMEVGWVMLPAP